MYSNIANGVAVAFQWQNLLWAFVGTALGIVIGAIPGLTATMGVALLVPMTFSMSPVAGLIMLSGIYCGAIYGGSISAILLRTPGTPASICTTYDGYPMTKQGRVKEALGVSIVASAFGGLLSAVSLLLFSPMLARFALDFGPFEYFALCVFGMAIITSIAEEEPTKGIASGIFGLMIATIGADPSTGNPRYWFNSIYLFSGLNLVPVLIGLFAIPEVFNLVFHRGEKVTYVGKVTGRLLPPIKELLSKTGTFIQASIIGIIVGIIPAIGPELAPFIAYDQAKRTSKHPEKFGTGIIDGIIASETSNNAVTGSSLVPTLTLGVPGSGVAAVFLGGLTIHGLQPGPLLFDRHPDLVYGLMVGFFIVNIFMLILGLSGTRVFSSIIKLPGSITATFILLFSILGSYALRNTMFDVWTMLVFGLLGYLIQEYNFLPGPIVLGLVLGPLMEDNLVRSLIIAKGSLLPFVTRPITVVFLLLSVGMVAWSIIKMRNHQEAAAG